MRHVWVWVLAIIAMVFVASLLFAAPARSHSWYDGTCCDEKDCRQTVLKEIERRDDGWFVVPTQELIGFSDKRIKRSLDPLIHVCMMPVWRGGKIVGEAVRCLYVPEVPV